MIPEVIIMLWWKSCPNVFTISEQKDYNVSSQYSQTIVNENQSVKLLSEILVNKILKKISSTNLNDL